MVAAKISIPKEQLQDFCKRWKVTEVALFGSVLRPDFSQASDVDVLVTFAPDARWTLFHFAQMRSELSLIFGRDVDLVSKRAIESSRNYLRRQAILSTAETIHVA